LLADFTELQKKYEELRKNQRDMETDNTEMMESIKEIAYEIRQLI